MLLAWGPDCSTKGLKECTAGSDVYYTGQAVGWGVLWGGDRVIYEHEFICRAKIHYLPNLQTKPRQRVNSVVLSSCKLTTKLHFSLGLWLLHSESPVNRQSAVNEPDLAFQGH